VWFRESEVPELLAKADDCVKQTFPSSSFSATHLIIATWDNVAASDTPDGMVSWYKSLEILFCHSYGFPYS